MIHAVYAAAGLTDPGPETDRKDTIADWGRIYGI